MINIEIYNISIKTHTIGIIRFDERSALLLNGSTIVYDHENDTFHLISSPTPENIEEARQELFSTRQAKADWKAKKIKRY